MIKTSYSKETRELVNGIVDNHLIYHTIQFFNKKSQDLFPFGSGVFAFINNTYFILTASHVASYIEIDKNDLYIRVDKTDYINVIGKIKCTDIDNGKGIDLAYIKLSPEMIPYLLKYHKPVTIDKFSKHSMRLDGLNYCLVGFPEKNIRLKDGLMETGADFILTSATNEKPYEYYKLSKDDYFIVDMKGKGKDLETGEKASIDTNFYGISGCGLWYIIFEHDTIDNQYTIDYRLIGIMTEFKKGKYFCLIANKIHLIINAFKSLEGYKITEKPSK